MLNRNIEGVLSEFRLLQKGFRAFDDAQPPRRQGLGSTPPQQPIICWDPFVILFVDFGGSVTFVILFLKVPKSNTLFMATKGDSDVSL